MITQQTVQLELGQNIPLNLSKSNEAKPECAMIVKLECGEEDARIGSCHYAQIIFVRDVIIELEPVPSHFFTNGFKPTLMNS